MAKKPISIASRKAKSRRLQNWTARMISHIIGLPCGRDEPVSPREMGQSGCDVRLVGDAKKLFPFSVEDKAQESWSVHSWIDQAKENQMPDTNWLLICKRNHEEPVAIIDARVFFAMFEEVFYGREELLEIYNDLNKVMKDTEDIKL